MSYTFNSESETKFSRLEKMFPEKRSMILPGLYLIQREKGLVDKEGMEFLAKRIGDPISVADVYGVATFYTMYNKKQVGKFHIQICSNISCYLSGSEEITQHICKKLGVDRGDTTSDKKYTVSEVQCLGACGYGPMMQVNEDYYEHLTPEKIDRILEELKD